jgi:hypothetical protein
MPPDMADEEVNKVGVALTWSQGLRTGMGS